MTNLHTSHWNSPHEKEIRGGTLERSKYLNLPDLQFYLLCQRNYKLNKGLYNTIENWFYEYGIDHIILRRLYLLAFLDFAKAGQNQGEHKFIRFGPGGLTRKLQQFIAEWVNEEVINE